MSRMFIKSLSAVVFFLLGGAVVEAGKPNILLIVADDLGYADIGVHGARDISTPAIDSLAHNGIRFTNGYVSGPYCSPTRAGLLTGRYQQRFGHEFNPGPGTDREMFGLPLTEATLADHFTAAGYRTGIVGKWHLGWAPRFHPLKRGFQEFFGFLGGGHSYWDPQADSSNPILRNHEAVNEQEYLTDAFGREARAFIERNRNQPWFLYLPFNAVHTPLQASSKYLERYKNIQDDSRRTYAAMTSAMDDAIGSILGKLRELKLEENTLIFFISDNGGLGSAGQGFSSNVPLRGYKSQTWEGGIRVPFLMQWKRKIPSGITYDLPVIQLDILPTALAAASVKVPPEWKVDGVDLTPYVTGRIKGTPHEALYWRLGDRMAVRVGDWKLLKSPEGETTNLRPGKGDLSGVQLFNLATNIGEQKDLSERESERVRVLKAVWTEWNSGLEQPRWLPLSKPGQSRRR